MGEASGLDKAGLARVHEVAERHVAAGDVPGQAWLLCRGQDVEVGVAGTAEDNGGGKPIARDTIFRIASMTKPIASVAAMILVEECWCDSTNRSTASCPSWPTARCSRPDGPIDDTVAAGAARSRSATSSRSGSASAWTSAASATADVRRARGARSVRRSAPAAGPPDPDQWIRLLGTVPLTFQPGERWLYCTSAPMSSACSSRRASGQPLETFLRDRIFEPLGMEDTAFSVPAARSRGSGTAYVRNLRTGESANY